LRNVAAKRNKINIDDIFLHDRYKLQRQTGPELQGWGPWLVNLLQILAKLRDKS